MNIPSQEFNQQFFKMEPSPTQVQHCNQPQSEQTQSPQLNSMSSNNSTSPAPSQSFQQINEHGLHGSMPSTQASAQVKNS